MAIHILSGRRRKSSQAEASKNKRGRKSRSLLQESPPHIDTSGGTYISAIRRSDQRRLQQSSNTIDSSWTPSSAKGYHHHSPLVARRANMLNGEKAPLMNDELDELGMIMARSRHLPGTWYFSSNHILVNGERTKRGIAPLVRNRELDELARRVAEDMARQGTVEHSDPHALMFELARPCRRLGENVARGASIRDIHRGMLKSSQADKNNMLDRRYSCMGMATARGCDGKLYLCQIFRA